MRNDLCNEQGYKQFAIEESQKRKTDPQWYAFASSRDGQSGERDLRFGFGNEGEATEYLRLLNSLVRTELATTKRVILEAGATDRSRRGRLGRTDMRRADWLDPTGMS
jgi:hypothetical protein